MNRTELLNYVKTNLRQLTTRYDDHELTHEIEAIMEDIEDSTGEPFDISSKMQCTILVTGVKARFGSDDKQEKYEAQYQKDLAKLSIRRMADSDV